MRKPDFRQIFTIIKFTIIREVRSRRPSTGKARQVFRIISLCAIFIMSGFAAGLICYLVPDNFSVALIGSLYITLIIASFVMTEYSILITGAEDFNYFSSLPVTAVDYFYSKIFTLLSYVFIIVILFYIPFSACLVTQSRPLSLILSNLYSLLVTGAATSLLLTLFYALILRILPKRAVELMASIFQLIVFFAVYGSFIILPRIILESGTVLTFSHSIFWLFIPAAWSPSIFRLGADIGANIAAGLSLISLPVLLVLCSKVISLEYAEKIADLNRTIVRKKPRRENRSVLRLATGEDSVIFKLIWTGLKYNHQFRNGILVIIPITVLYFLIVMFSQGGAILDPFSRAGIQMFDKTILFYVAIGFFPVYIKNSLVYSTESEASWVFYTTPCSRLKMILAARKFIVFFFIVPYLLIFVVFYMVLTGAYVHVLMHFLTVLLLSLIQTNLFLLYFAETPFSRKLERGQRMGLLFIRMLIGMVMPLPIYLFVIFFYKNMTSYGLLLAGLFIVLAVMELAGRKIAERQLGREEHSGSA
ncbi:MAG: hypothetical protein JW969_19160 [Spirochaetales bacterium]|nr:hypothetical protein [Spirochaetales bacterium]